MAKTKKSKRLQSLRNVFHDLGLGEIEDVITLKDAEEIRNSETK